MKFPRRKFLHLAAGAVALPAAPHIARAQAIPTRPVRVIVGFPPGESLTYMARLMLSALGERLISNHCRETVQGQAAVLLLSRL